MKPIFTGLPLSALEPEPPDAGVPELDEHAATNEHSAATMSVVTESALKRIRGKTPPSGWPATLPVSISLDHHIIQS
jgi:hypothetical protein